MFIHRCVAECLQVVGMLLVCLFRKKAMCAFG